LLRWPTWRGPPVTRQSGRGDGKAQRKGRKGAGGWQGSGASPERLAFAAVGGAREGDGHGELLSLARYVRARGWRRMWESEGERWGSRSAGWCG
jgi:hypothetical protein